MSPHTGLAAVSPPLMRMPSVSPRGMVTEPTARPIGNKAANSKASAGNHSHARISGRGAGPASLAEALPKAALAAPAVGAATLAEGGVLIGLRPACGTSEG